MVCAKCDGVFSELGANNTCPICWEPFKPKAVVVPSIPSITDVANQGQSSMPAVPADLVDAMVEAEKEASVGLSSKPKHQPFQYDLVDHPHHYQGNGMESIDVIEAFDLGFLLGNTVKYVLRAGKKDNEKQDLKKAIWYLQRRIQQLEKEKN